MEITVNLLLPPAGGAQPPAVDAGEGALGGRTTDGLFALLFSQVVSAGGNRRQSADELLSFLQSSTEESNAPVDLEETGQSASPSVPVPAAELLAMAVAPLMQQAPVILPRQTVQPDSDHHESAHDAPAVAPLSAETVAASLPQLPMEQANADVTVQDRLPEFPHPQATGARATRHAEGEISSRPASSQPLPAAPATPAQPTPVQSVTATPAQPVTAASVQPAMAIPAGSITADAAASPTVPPMSTVAVPATTEISAQPVKPMQPLLKPDMAVVADQQQPQQQTEAEAVTPDQPQAADVQTPAPAKARFGQYPVPPPARPAGFVMAEAKQAATETGEVATSVETGAATVETMVQDAASQEGPAFGDNGSRQHLGGRGNEASPSAMLVSADAVKEQHGYQSLEKVENSPAPDHDRIISQVREKLAGHDVRDAGSISMTLHPEELGELKIMLHMNDQRLKVEIIAQNQSVREALMQNLDGLRDTLSRQNITVDRFDVNTGGGFDQAFREGRQTAQDQHYRHHQKFGFSATQADSERQTTASLWQPREDSLVDVHF